MSQCQLCHGHLSNALISLQKQMILREYDLDPIYLNGYVALYQVLSDRKLAQVSNGTKKLPADQLQVGPQDLD